MEGKFTRQGVAALERRYDFKAARSLGQNFVTDPQVTENIIAATGAGPQDLLIEIGPGLGVITAEASRRCGKLVAIEVDKKLLPILAETVGWQPNVKIINEDILKADLEAIAETERELPGGGRAERVKVIGNLPYYITTPILNKLLGLGNLFSSITVMVQKEVAEKMTASPGSGNYGVISVKVQYFCSVEYIMDVPREVFMPQPKVDSSVLMLRIKEDKGVGAEDEDLLFELVREGFARRRKTLANALGSFRGMDRERIKNALKEAGIDPARRAETLSAEEFATLSNCLCKGLR